MKTKLLNMRGFTLVELMIVVAIIGILASVAIPQYQEYTRNATVQAALSEASQFKTAVAICAQTNAMTGCNAGSAGVPATRNTVTAVVDGVLTIVPGGSYDAAQSLTYTPSNSGTEWTLTCTGVAPAGAPNLCTNSEVTGNPDF